MKTLLAQLDILRRIIAGQAGYLIPSAPDGQPSFIGSVPDGEAAKFFLALQRLFIAVGKVKVSELQAIAGEVNQVWQSTPLNKTDNARWTAIRDGINKLKEKSQ